MTIGQNIRQLRRDAGLSQEDLAEIAQVTNKAVSSWEIGGRTPRLGALRRISEHFKIPVSDLLRTDGPESPPITPKNEPDPPRHRPDPNPQWTKATSLRESAAPWISQPATQQLATAYAMADEVTRSLVCRALGIEMLPVHRPAMAMDWLADTSPTREIIIYDRPSAAWTPLLTESRYERQVFPADVVPAGTDFGVRIGGDGMPPTLRPGDIAFVRKVERIGAGEVGIFMVDGELAYLRCARGSGGGLELRRDSADQAAIDANAPDVLVLGVVLGTTPR